MIKSLAPNPASDYVTVNYKLACDISDAKLEVSDINGNPMTYAYIDNLRETQQISLAGFIPGTYYVKLITNGVVDTKTLIKQ